MVILFGAALLLVLALLGLAHWYLWRRLVRDTTRGPGPARTLGTVLFVVAPVLMLAAFAGSRALPFGVLRVVAWPGYLWAALALYLLLAVALGELLRPLLFRVTRGRYAREGETTATATATATASDGAGADAERAPDPERGADAAPGPGPAEAPGPRGAVAAEPVPVQPLAAEPVPAGDARPGPERARPAPSRRLFVSRIVGGAAGAAALGTVGAGAYGVLRGPRLKHVTIPLAKLPRAAHGFRVAVVSDIHLGPILGHAHTRRIVDTINGAQPDAIAVVGDLVDGSVAQLGHAAQPLSDLRARHGAYFVTGNHEYYSGADEWIDEVRELGLRPLENARVELPGFDLAGVNDISGEDHHAAPDYDKALGDRDPARASVLMAHQPVMIHEAVERGVDLQLSGHTHGGQLFPGNLLARAANPTVAGLDHYGDTTLYVTRGAGAWGPPVRVGAPSDITVVTLAARGA
ncbi:metallophosphoesterase [Streptomyces sp. SPB074]|uniref:metallophosphoesterase n=1 Tax=Streptomyces sp. (strain SPB074) TaxID=465543 RepID=UPI00017F160B|nr:metallophosphoesterase [Streptomyces sp. SPB074]EDY44742.2 integral membrane protein [Streptomyces sp. SPB074]